MSLARIFGELMDERVPAYLITYTVAWRNERAESRGTGELLTMTLFRYCTVGRDLSCSKIFFTKHVPYDLKRFPIKSFVSHATRYFRSNLRLQEKWQK